MTWVKIDEEFARHPKVVKAGPLGMAMQVAALCYANQYLTDGHVPRSVAAGLLHLEGFDVGWLAIVEDLVTAGLWIRDPGGWRIHDYDHYQPTKAQVLAERLRKKAAGQKGGLARAKQRASGVLSTDSSARQAETQAESKPVPVPGNSSSPKAAAAVTSRVAREGAASPSSAVASGDADEAAQDQERCRHRNDPTTCGICSPAVGVAPAARLSETLRRPPQAPAQEASP